MMSREAESGFSRLAGTRVRGSIVLREGVLRDLLRRYTDLPRGLDLRIASANRLVLSYGVFRTGVVVADSVDLPSRRLQLVLDSAAIGWLLRLVVSAPAMEVKGRYVSIDLHRLGMFREYEFAWPLLRHVGLSTSEGVVHLQVDIAVT